MLDVFQMKILGFLRDFKLKLRRTSTLVNAANNIAFISQHFNILLNIILDGHVVLLALVTVSKIVENEGEPDVDTVSAWFIEQPSHRITRLDQFKLKRKEIVPIPH
uniref:Uncharacterized protein n=1 Tax=Cacopsylla melanoneura TaxID=428564 RepID=A0A8D8THL1_9HEMI